VPLRGNHRKLLKRCCGMTLRSAPEFVVLMLRPRSRARVLKQCRGGVSVNCQRSYDDEYAGRTFTVAGRVKRLDAASEAGSQYRERSDRLSQSIFQPEESPIIRALFWSGPGAAHSGSRS
jgi:hypothetical protein